MGDVKFNEITLEMDVQTEKIFQDNLKKPKVKFENIENNNSNGDENISCMPKKTPIQREKITSVEVPYFDMSLSESDMSDESEEEIVVDTKNIEGKRKNQRKSAQAARGVWSDLNIEDEVEDDGENVLEEAEEEKVEFVNEDILTDVNQPKKYDRANIKDFFKKEVVVSTEQKSKEGGESLQSTEPFKICTPDESFIVNEEEEYDSFDSDECESKVKKRKNTGDKDSDFVPEEEESSAGESVQSAAPWSEDEFDLQLSETDPLVNLGGTRYSNFDDALICAGCEKCHSSRSECQLYSSSVNYIPDAVATDGSTLYEAESMPDMLKFVDDADFSRGVVAKSLLEPLMRFGPLIAQELMIYTLGFDSNLADVWLAIEEDEKFTAFTTEKSVRSNWLRYIRPANFVRSANVMLVTIEKQLYFVVIKLIFPNEELRFWQDEHRNLARWAVLQSRRGVSKHSCGMTRAKFLSRHHYRIHLILYHNFHVRGVLRYHNFYCHVCNQALFRKEALVEHCQSEHGVKPWKCPLCFKFIPRSSVVRQHTRECGKNVEAIRHPCNICGKLFVRGFYLKRHISTVHLGLREFTCEYCGLQFSTDRSVRRHITAVHDGQQPHVCDKCGRRFSQSSNLKVHLLTHSGVKPFQCCEEGCSAAFTTKQCLQFHYVRVHKYNNDTMPEIQRGVPFTYEDHSFGVGNTQDNEMAVPKSRKRGLKSLKKSTQNGNYDDDNEEEEEERKMRRKRKTKLKRNRRNGKGRVVRNTRPRRKIKVPIRYIRDKMEDDEEWLSNEARKVVMKVEMQDDGENATVGNEQSEILSEIVTKHDVLNDIMAKSDLNERKKLTSSTKENKRGRPKRTKAKKRTRRKRKTC